MNDAEVKLKVLRHALIVARRSGRQERADALVQEISVLEQQLGQPPAPEAPKAPHQAPGWRPDSWGGKRRRDNDAKSERVLADLQRRLKVRP